MVLKILQKVSDTVFFHQGQLAGLYLKNHLCNQ